MFDIDQRVRPRQDTTDLSKDHVYIVRSVTSILTTVPDDVFPLAPRMFRVELFDDFPGTSDDTIEVVDCGMLLRASRS